MKLELEVSERVMEGLVEMAARERRTVAEYAAIVLDKHLYGHGQGGSYTPEELERFRARKSPVRDLLTAKQRNNIFERDGGKCAYCKGVILYDEPWHIDHIKPVSKGGTNDPKNLTLSCVACNLKKANK